MSGVRPKNTNNNNNNNNLKMAENGEVGDEKLY